MADPGGSSTNGTSRLTGAGWSAPHALARSSLTTLALIGDSRSHLHSRLPLPQRLHQSSNTLHLRQLQVARTLYLTAPLLTTLHTLVYFSIKSTLSTFSHLSIYLYLSIINSVPMYTGWNKRIQTPFLVYINIVEPVSLTLTPWAGKGQGRPILICLTKYRNSSSYHYCEVADHMTHSSKYFSFKCVCLRRPLPQRCVRFFDLHFLFYHMCFKVAAPHLSSDLYLPVKVLGVAGC